MPAAATSDPTASPPQTPVRSAPPSAPLPPGETPAPAPAPAAPPPATPPRPSISDPPPTEASTAAGDDAALLDVLKSGSASAIDISRAVMQVIARRVARAHQADVLGHNDIDSLKKALQELRNAEADYIQLEEQKRELIPRGEVRVIVTECAMRLIRVLDSLENKLALEFSLWLADPLVAAMTADDRARKIRQHISHLTRTARITEADEIERLLDHPPEA
jgi:hypothetical protein